MQQIKFPLRQRQCLVLEAHSTAEHIDAQVSERERLALLFRFFHVPASQSGTYPGVEFLELKRFGEVVVCPQIQGLHLFVQIVMGGQHQHRCLVTAAAQPPADFNAIKVRQCPIQNEEIKPALTQVLECFGAVDRADALRLFTRELIQQKLQQFWIVINDEQPGAGLLQQGAGTICRNPTLMVGGMFETVALIPVVSWFGRRPPSQSGFVMPLAITASAVLLLGSASIHTLSLQKRLRLHASGQREQSADQLRSAAQAFVVASRGPQACLLQWPSHDWPAAVHDCKASDPSQLSRGVVGEKLWSLLDWTPHGENGALRLQLADGRTGRFRLALDPLAPAVLGISDVGLQARVPQLKGE